MDRYRPYDPPRTDRWRKERQRMRQRSESQLQHSPQRQLPNQQQQHNPVLGQSAELTYKLYTVIDYRELNVDRPRSQSRQSILAHALMYIQLLTLNRTITTPAQFKNEKLIHDGLKDSIPISYYVGAGCRSAAHAIGGVFRADQTFTLIAAREYICDLIKERGERNRPRPNWERRSQRENLKEEHMAKDPEDIGHRVPASSRPERRELLQPTKVSTLLQHDGGEERPKRPNRDESLPSEVEKESEKTVMKSLDKIEIWITLWLKGKLNTDEDWKTFEQCVSVPDEMVERYHRCA